MTRDFPPAFGGSRLASPVRRLVLSCATAVVALAVALTCTPVRAQADELDDQKKQVQAKLAQSASDLSEYNREAVAATQALRASQTKLADAQAKLAAAQSALADSRALDRQRAAELTKAQAELSAARDQAAAAQRDVQAWTKESGARVRETMQQRNPLAGVGIMVTNVRVEELNDRVQWSTTVLDSTQAKLDRLTALKLRKDAAEAKATQIESQVSRLRDEAAAGLKQSQRLEGSARQAESEVATAHLANQKAKATADAHVAAELKNQAVLEAEDQAVDRRIQVRIAAQKKAAAEKARRDAAAARQAAQQRAAQQRAAQQKAAQDRAAAAKRAGSTSTTSRSTTPSRPAPAPVTTDDSSSSGGWIYPSTAAITSPYGMRVHPVTGVFKLHDGTDFGASCGAPLRAARAGVVAERYFNSAYGNRLMIDHGLVNGQYITTGYNHAQNYIVSVGQRVEKGQIIGYVGTTGLSTGCHLHLMVWANGERVNPMSIL